jgi:hypothetical protein
MGVRKRRHASQILIPSRRRGVGRRCGRCGQRSTPARRWRASGGVRPGSIRVTAPRFASPRDYFMAKLQARLECFHIRFAAGRQARRATPSSWASVRPLSAAARNCSARADMASPFGNKSRRTARRISGKAPPQPKKALATVQFFGEYRDCQVPASHALAMRD